MRKAWWVFLLIGNFIGLNVSVLTHSFGWAALQGLAVGWCVWEIETINAEEK